MLQPCPHLKPDNLPMPPPPSPRPVRPLSPTEQAFLDELFELRLQAADFDHRGHLRAGWLLLRAHALPQAIELCCDGIQALARHLGAADKYHRTVTEALLRLMAAGGAAGQSWSELEQSQPLLFSDARALLARHYSSAQLARPEARIRFLPPDLQPLPEVDLLR